MTRYFVRYSAGFNTRTTIRTDLLQCTLVICKLMLQKCIKFLKVLHQRYLQIFFSSNSRVNCDLHYQSEFSEPLVISVFNGTDTISYLCQRIWDLVPLEMKQKESLTAFKKTIKTWYQHNSPCRLCKNMLLGWDLFEI